MYIKGLFGQYRVVCVAICANMMSFSIGVCIGWASPVVPKLRAKTLDSSLDVVLTTAQGGWTISLFAIGAFIASFLIGSLATSFGRKGTLLLCSVFIFISYIFLILATDIWFVYAARFLQGFGAGVGGSMIPMYIGEIATDDNRGALGTLMTIFLIGGILYTYSIGPHVSYLALQYYCICIPIFFFATFMFMPESPYYFAIKGQTNDLINSLKALRGKSAKDVENERVKIQKEVDDSMSNKSELIDIVQNRVYRKALFIVCGLLFFQQMSGATAVTFNSQSIFINAGSTLDSAIGPIILGVVELISNLLSLCLVQSMGRKIILLVSSMGMLLALVTLGFFFCIQAFSNASNILWLPVPALILFSAFFGLGFGPLPWIMMGEMFPSNIKATATTIASTCTCLVIFVVMRWFPELNALGAYYAFCVFGGFCGLAFIFVKFVVIETKGLSLQMIQAKLQDSTEI